MISARAGQGGQDLEVFTADETWAVPLTSDLDFEQALEGYQAGDHVLAARCLKEGIAALRNEAKDNDPSLRLIPGPPPTAGSGKGSPASTQVELLQAFGAHNACQPGGGEGTKGRKELGLATGGVLRINFR